MSFVDMITIKNIPTPQGKSGDAATGVAHGPVVVDEGGGKMRWGFHVVNVYGIIEKKKSRLTQPALTHGYKAPT